MQTLQQASSCLDDSYYKDKEPVVCLSCIIPHHLLTAQSSIDPFGSGLTLIHCNTHSFDPRPRSFYIILIQIHQHVDLRQSCSCSACEQTGSWHSYDRIRY